MASQKIPDTQYLVKAVLWQAMIEERVCYTRAWV